jgi:hypothetical protein
MPIWGWGLLVIGAIVLLSWTIEGVGRVRTRIAEERKEPSERAPVIEGSFDAASRIVRIDDLDRNEGIGRAS